MYTMLNDSQDSKKKKKKKAIENYYLGLCVNFSIDLSDSQSTLTSTYTDVFI